jgi:hypothetical protein
MTVTVRIQIEQTKEEHKMNRQDFFEWLDTIIDKGYSDWEIVEDFADGNILIKFTNIEEEILWLRKQLNSGLI